MNFEELKQSWQSEIQVTDNQTDFSKSIDDIEKRVAKFDSHIRWRDFREVGTGLLIIPFFAYWLITTAEHWMTMTGLVVILLGLILYPIMIYRAKKVPSKKLHSIKSFLESEKLKVLKQVKLLESLFWWHVGPLGVGVFLSVIGSNIERNGSLVWETGLIYYLICCVLFFIALVIGNKWWARKKYQPIIDELDQKLKQLDGLKIIN